MQAIFGKGLLARPCEGRGARGPGAPLKCPGAGGGAGGVVGSPPLTPGGERWPGGGP